MSNLDKKALMTSFQNWKGDRMPTEKDDDAFEIFCIDQILKDRELSDEETATGILGGKHDGGIDGFYFFINNHLISKDSPKEENAFLAELYLIQVTRSDSFGEGKVDKMEAFCRNLFDGKNISKRANLNQRSKNAIQLFRERYEAILAHRHTLKIHLIYATTSHYPPTSNMLSRVMDVEVYIKSKVSLAEVIFTPWGSAALLKKVREFPSKILTLGKIQVFSTEDKSVVCLSRVAEFFQFITDEKTKQLRTWMLEPNVRDYQGGATVNKQIRKTLAQGDQGTDFWWLNNGITILANDCEVSGNRVRITNPEIVNGLQTSHEIFNAFTRNEIQPKDERCLLVKVIVASDDKMKNAIIKATNSQTKVNALSLRATDSLHFDIEDKLLSVGLYYDRRKGKYKQHRKPIKSIISMKAMGQAILAAYLQNPSDARGRPESPLNKEAAYQTIFNDSYGQDFFASCILLDRQCAEYVGNSALPDDQQTDLRFYVTMLAAAELSKEASPSYDDLADLLDILQSPISPALLDSCLNLARAEYVFLGGSDKVAKGQDLQAKLKAHLNAKFPGD